MGALLCLLFIILQQGRSKLVMIPLVILLLQLSSRYQDASRVQNIRNDTLSQTSTGAEQPRKILNFEGAKCENSLTDPVKCFTFKPPAFNETDRETPTSPSKV